MAEVKETQEIGNFDGVVVGFKEYGVGLCRLDGVMYRDENGSTYLESDDASVTDVKKCKFIEELQFTNGKEETKIGTDVTMVGLKKHMLDGTTFNALYTPETKYNSLYRLNCIDREKMDNYMFFSVLIEKERCGEDGEEVYGVTVLECTDLLTGVSKCETLERLLMYEHYETVLTEAIKMSEMLRIRTERDKLGS